MNRAVKAYGLEYRLTKDKNSRFLFISVTARFMRKRVLNSTKAYLKKLSYVSNCEVLSPLQGVSLPIFARAVPMGTFTLLVELNEAADTRNFITKEVALLNSNLQTDIPKYSGVSHALVYILAVCKSGLFMDLPTYVSTINSEGYQLDSVTVTRNLITTYLNSLPISELKNFSTLPLPPLGSTLTLEREVLYSNLVAPIEALIKKKEDGHCESTTERNKK